jgi:hypothetical protein
MDVGEEHLGYARLADYVTTEDMLDDASSSNWQVQPPVDNSVIGDGRHPLDRLADINPNHTLGDLSHHSISTGDENQIVHDLKPYEGPNLDQPDDDHTVW